MATAFINNRLLNGTNTVYGGVSIVMPGAHAPIYPIITPMTQYNVYQFLEDNGFHPSGEHDVWVQDHCCETPGMTLCYSNKWCDNGISVVENKYMDVNGVEVCQVINAVTGELHNLSPLAVMGEFCPVVVPPITPPSFEEGCEC